MSVWIGKLCSDSVLVFFICLENSKYLKRHLWNTSTHIDSAIEPACLKLEIVWKQDLHVQIQKKENLLLLKNYSKIYYLDVFHLFQVDSVPPLHFPLTASRLWRHGSMEATPHIPRPSAVWLLSTVTLPGIARYLTRVWPVLPWGRACNGTIPEI